MKKIMLIILSLFALTYIQAMERGEESENESEDIELSELKKLDELDDFVFVEDAELTGIFPLEIMIIIISFIPNAIEQVDTKSVISRTKTALGLAPKSEKLGIFNWMLVNKQFNALMKNTKILVPLLKHIVEKSPQKAITACIFAASSGKAEVINLLIKAGLAINDCDANGFSALMMGTIMSRPNLVKWLIKQGADVHTYWDGNCNSIPKMKVFKNYQPFRLTKKMTPLMIASANDAVLTAEILLKAGVNIDAQDNDGNTALMFAASRGLVKTVNILISHNANAYLTNNRKNDAIILARVGNKEHIIELLVKHDPKLIHSLLSFWNYERQGNKKSNSDAI